jgi:hypothetical protein
MLANKTPVINDKWDLPLSPESQHFIVVSLPRLPALSLRSKASYIEILFTLSRELPHYSAFAAASSSQTYNNNTAPDCSRFLSATLFTAQKLA